MGMPPQPPYSWQPPQPEQPPQFTAWGAGGGGSTGGQPHQPRRRRRRIFPWVFLAVQVLFAVWVVAGAASGGSIHSDAVAWCHAHPDPYTTFSQCVSSYGGGEKAGAAIGIGLIVAFWAVVDIILGVSYGVWRLARR